MVKNRGYLAPKDIAPGVGRGVVVLANLQENLAD